MIDTQNSTAMSGTTRVKTTSGQTILTRNSSASDRPTTYCIRSSVCIHWNVPIHPSLFSRFHLHSMPIKPSVIHPAILSSSSWFSFSWWWWNLYTFYEMSYMLWYHAQELEIGDFWYSISGEKSILCFGL